MKSNEENVKQEEIRPETKLEDLSGDEAQQDQVKGGRGKVQQQDFGP